MYEALSFEGFHLSCAETFLNAAAAIGWNSPWIPDPFNFFQRVCHSSHQRRSLMRLGHVARRLDDRPDQRRDRRSNRWAITIDMVSTNPRVTRPIPRVPSPEENATATMDVPAR